MIKTLFLNPLGPSLILVLGGLLLLLLRRQGRVNAAWMQPIAILSVLAAGAALLALRTGPPGSGLLQWNWQPLTTSGSALSWHLDGWNWLAGLLVLLSAAAVLALQGDQPGADTGPLRSQRLLLLAAAALTFVFSDNLVTLACAWIFLDIALVLRMLPAEAPQPAGRVWLLLGLGSVTVLAALIFQGAAKARTPLIGGAFAGPILPLLWLGGMVRAGAYPLHFWLTGRRSGHPADEAALHLLAPIPGIWLLGRVHLAAGAAWLHRPEWAALGTLALFGTALAAWVAVDGVTTWRWIALNRASLVVLTAYVAGSAGPPALVWPLITFVLGAGLLALGLDIRGHGGWRLPLWLGGLALYGLPGTPGFLARWMLVWPTDLAAGRVQGTPAQLPFGLLLFGLILVAEILLAAALWRLVVPGDGLPVAEPAAALARVAAWRAVPLPNGRVIARVGGAVFGWGERGSGEHGPGEHEVRPYVIANGRGDPGDRPLAAGEHAAVGPYAATVAPAAANTIPAPAAPSAALRGPHAEGPAGRGRSALAVALDPPAGTTPGSGATGPSAAPAAVFGAPRPPLAERLAPAWTALSLFLATTAFVVAVLAWGLSPRQPLALAGLTASGLPLTLFQALAAARRSVWAGLLLAGALGALLGWRRGQIFQGMRGWQEGILAVVSLEWLYQAVVAALAAAGSTLQYFARLGEGEGYIGWLALAGLILWILLRS